MNSRNTTQTVFVVDDNADMRHAVRDFLQHGLLTVETFASAKDFLAAYSPEKSGCLVLDIHMPGMSGLELQEHLVLNKIFIPTIISSGRAVVTDAVRSMKMGTFEFLEKPYSSEVLLKCVRKALEVDRLRRQGDGQLTKLRLRYEQLTERERQILAQVVFGKQSKHIADHLGIAISTVDNHRSNIMRKLQAETSADLTRIALLIDPTMGLSTE